MKSNFIYALTFAAGLFIVGSCSKDDNPGNPIESQIEKSVVINTYADIALSNYQKALQDAQTLKTAINTFVSNPTEGNFKNAKTAWFNARESYGTSEAFRFANGPIDSGDTEEMEGLLNSWPLDEAFIDYVEGDENAGIINSTANFPILSKQVLMEQNGNNGEENVTVGYHAIEFLLWGQDLTAPSANLPGQRAYTDYVDGGTATNQVRRREYLSICADLLTENLQTIVDLWAGQYRTVFISNSENANIDNILSSIAELSRSELAIERIAVALNNQDQEDEHSCFSDNTNRDIRLNLQGVANVYNGSYGSINGASLNDLILEADPILGAELSSLLSTAQTAVEATLDPFDLAISEGASSVEGAKVQAAVLALVAFGDKLLEARPALGLN